MYNESITLILGAGASVKYGYPTGSQLIQDISKADIEKIFSDRITPIEWKKRLKETQPQSIDYFMSLDQNLMLTVKPYMYLYLLAKENVDATLTLDYTNHWYNSFFDKLIVQKVEVTKRNLSRIKVITFNYDRSLEYYLSRVIKQRCFHNDIDYSNAFKLMQTMDIHHVYDRLPWLTGEKQGEPGLEYGSVSLNDITSSRAHQHLGLVNGGELFKICHEKIDEIKINTNYSFIRNTDNVLFLGFGFHEENMKVLKHEFNNSHIKYYATCHGLAGAKKFWLKENYSDIEQHDKMSHELVQQFYDTRMLEMNSKK